MNKYFKNRTILAFMVCSSMALLSCSDTFLDKAPLDRPNPANFFVNETSAQNANSAIYNFWLRNADMYGRDLWIILDAMTDDAHWRSNRAVSIQQAQWDIYPTHGPINAYWRETYRSINAANFAIEGIPNSTDDSFTGEIRQRYIAEARFMRAFDYLFLVTLYGDVPLILKTLNTFDDYNQPVTPKAKIYAAIIEDLEFAKDNLPPSWPSSYQGRPTRAAAATYLAQAYLFMGDDVNAEAAAREAITIAEGDGYAMVNDYESLFDEETEVNSEIIFSFQFVYNSPDMGTNTTVQINNNPSETEFKNINGIAWAYSLPQRSLYDAFEADDPRRGYTIFAPGDFYGTYAGPDKTITHRDYNAEGVEYTYDRSYTAGDPVYWQHYWSQTGLGIKKMETDLKGITNERWSGKDIPLMRMAELYLFLAEALAEQGKAEALDWVNKVRDRASVSLPHRELGDGRPGSTLVDIVRHERRVELGMECKRLFDIMRWKIVGEIFQGENVKRHFYWEYLPADQAAVRFDTPPIELPKHYYFPIPQAEIDINPLINDNNPGY